MSSKGGVHINDATPGVDGALGQIVPNWIKSLVPIPLDTPPNNPNGVSLRSLHARNPDVRIVYRSVYDGGRVEDIAADTDETLRRFDSARLPGVETIVEVPRNEMDTGVGDRAQLQRYVDATIPTLDRYAQHGFKVAVGCFGVGWPRLEDVDILVPLLQETAKRGGYLAVHEYWLPTKGLNRWQENWSWWGMRYRRVWNLIREVAPIPILITECGIDGGLEGRSATGWKGYNVPASSYATQVTAYLQQLADDPFVHGAMFYCLDALDKQWSSFTYWDAPEVLSALVAPMASRQLWIPSEDAEVSGPADLSGAESNPPPLTGGPPVVTLKGIDVSNNQGTINWASVKASGVEFAMIKASGDEGSSNVFLDGYFPRNWLDAGAVPMVRGAYHYARPSAVSPSQSVTTFQRALQAVGGLKAGDLIALDIEDPAVPDGTSLHVWVAEWLALAEQVFGVAAFKYSGRYYTSTHDLEHADMERFPTWWASWQPTKPAPVAGWTPITIWQTSATGSVPGVTGACDLNVFEGTVADLRAFGLRSPAPTPVPTPPPTPAPTPTPGIPDLTERTYGLAHQIRALSDEWRAAGYPQAAEGIDAGANAVERFVSIVGKGEK